MSLVSIITPLYNSELYIDRTIQSLLKQTYKNWELFIIDDCSSDNGLQIAKYYSSRDSRINILQNNINMGAAVTRNNGIEASNGKYIAFLDSDDQWHPDKLSVQVQFMEQNKVGFTYTFYNHINEEGEEIYVGDNLPKKVDYESTMKNNKIGCLTAIYNVHMFGKTYMKDIRKRQDYTLWLQLLKKTEYAYCVPKVLATYTVREGSISSNKLSLIKYHWHIYRNIESQSLVKSLYYLSYYIFSRLTKK